MLEYEIFQKVIFKVSFFQFDSNLLSCMWSTVIIVGVYKKNYYYQKKLPLILNFKPISFLSLSSDRLIFFSIYYAILRFILLLPILCFFHYLSFLTDGHESYYISFCSPILYSYSPLGQVRSSEIC